MSDDQNKSEDEARLETFFRGEAGSAGHLYVGSGFLHCGACGGTMNAHRYYASRHTRTRVVYRCRRDGCASVTVDATIVDPELMNFVVSRLSEARFAPQRARMRIEQIDKELSKEQLDLRGKKERKSMRRFLRRHYNNRISRSLADRIIDEMIEDKDRKAVELAAERKLLAEGGTSSRSKMVPPDVVSAMWNAANVHERRDMLATALGTDRLLIDPAPGDGSPHKVLRVKVHPA